jgi:diguanylate cyclase (GGDEF)-like protein
LARYGGEEFVVVMPGAGPHDAKAAAERLRAAVAAMPFDILGARAQLTVSIGIACTHGRAASPEMLLHAADLALYEAKRNGRNRVEIAPVDGPA